jgi:hypothetical protein
MFLPQNVFFRPVVYGIFSYWLVTLNELRQRAIWWAVTNTASIFKEDEMLVPPTRLHEVITTIWISTCAKVQNRTVSVERLLPLDLKYMWSHTRVPRGKQTRPGHDPLPGACAPAGYVGLPVATDRPVYDLACPTVIKQRTLAILQLWPNKQLPCLNNTVQPNRTSGKPELSYVQFMVNLTVLTSPQTT